MRLCVGVPVYQTELNPDELVSMEHLKRNAAGVDLFLIAPQGLIVKNVPEGLSFSYQYFDGACFRNVNTYSALLLNPDFYRAFADRGYEFLLVVQTDALLLKPIDETWEAFFRYDYIGAAWIPPEEAYAVSFKGISAVKKLFHPRKCTVGNGGFSLRNIEKCIALLEEKKKYTRIWNAGEDTFFAYHGQESRTGFRIAPPELAETFALEARAGECIRNGQAPCGIHAWRKFYPEYIMETTKAEAAYETPVVIVIFKRKEATERLLALLGRIRPAVLYVISDAARSGNAEEARKVEETRACIGQISWNCDVRKIYAEENMGCDDRIISGLHEVFREVDRAVILEDDCLPVLSFFYFCEEMLENYKTDERIFYVSGNYMSKPDKRESSYFFSERGDTWGWACWADSWNFMRGDFEKDWEEIKQKELLQKYRGSRQGEAFIRELEAYRDKPCIPWDYKWQAYSQAYGKLVIVPAANLVENTGFDEDATHTVSAPGDFSLKASEIPFPLISPKEEKPDRKYDTIRYREIFNQSYFVRIRNRMRIILHKMRENQTV